MSYVSPRRLERFWDDAKTWIAGKYEPKIIFGDTPVYSVTLAEDVSLSSSDTFDIVLTGGNYKRCNIYTVAPAVDANRNLRVRFSMASEISVATAFTIAATSARYGIVRFINDSGLAYCDACAGSGGGAANITVFTGSSSTPPTPVGENDTIASISLFSTSSVIIPAGTTITVYAAEEV